MGPDKQATDPKPELVTGFFDLIISYLIYMQGKLHAMGVGKL
jgi:hypothetical protein